ncbi:uncharacterized protein OCT59_002323 [Rhizophagus irregularis]|uniref:Uncharacterized protein n=2 Tax=Rhizophagus irregularis TaxID=588596 RepID=U9TG25_RHIID|nr:hypothetical protein OCT59_002323 [Rhizophagus irregularis]GBC47015.1 hypothetical protein GLOIN_2v1484674 [Rhizophagus irregularis DAOM 181602=DAOM 197198]
MSNKSEEKNMEPRAPFKWSKESDEKLKKLKEELKASINWSEVDKWNADGRPYEEHEEILMFLNENEFISLESNGTGCTGIDRERKQSNEGALYTSSRKSNRTSREECRSKTPTEDATTPGRYYRQYRSKVVGSHQISNSIANHRKNTQ